MILNLGKLETRKIKDTMGNIDKNIFSILLYPLDPLKNIVEDI